MGENANIASRMPMLYLFNICFITVSVKFVNDKTEIGIMSFRLSHKDTEMGIAFDCNVPTFIYFLFIYQFHTKFHNDIVRTKHCQVHGCACYSLTQSEQTFERRNCSMNCGKINNRFRISSFFLIISHVSKLNFVMISLIAFSKNLDVHGCEVHQNRLYFLCQRR